MIFPVAAAHHVFAVHSIGLSRGGQTVLKDISLELRPGECVAVVGPNGAGKSTLLKVLSGDLVPQAGEVILEGVPLPKWNRRELARRRAVLPQSSELLFPFPVRDVVLMGRSPHNDGVETAEDRRIADAAIETVDLWALRDRPYDRLSGGERQRVQLARVLAQVWPIDSSAGNFLLLDEPTSSLDLFHQHTFLQTVKLFTGLGLGVLVVLHDLNLAMQYADRVMVLFHGHSVACDEPEKAFVPELIREVFQVEARTFNQPGQPHSQMQFQLS